MLVKLAFFKQFILLIPTLTSTLTIGNPNLSGDSLLDWLRLVTVYVNIYATFV